MTPISPSYDHTYRVQDADRPLRETAKLRLLFLWSMLCFGFLVIAGRLVHLSCLNLPEDASLSTSSSPRLTNRANIIDCRGEILATSIRTASLYINPKDLLDPEEALQKLQKIFPELDTRKLHQKIQEGRGFIWIKRHLTPSQQYAVLKCGIPGACFQKDEKRVYLQGALVSHVLGLTNVDHEGISGLEKYAHDFLCTSSEPLKTTIDLRIQSALHHILKASLQEFQASGAVGIVMDIHTGAIRALTSLPDYDLNQPQHVDPKCLFNKATTGAWEMGSIFKTLTMAMALEQGSASFKSRYDATQPIHVGHFKITDFQAQNRHLSLPEVFVYSSNIGTSRIALELGAHAQQAFLKKMGLLEPLHLEIPETGIPLIPSRWSDVTTMTVSYGYGLSTTLVQTLAAISSLVNGGILYRPTLLENTAHQAQGHQVLRHDVSLKMRQLMRMVVLEGSGKKAEVSGFNVIGKTGTAHINTGGRYNKDSVRTTFAGAFPAHDPQYALMIMLEDPHATPSTFGFRTAGWNAAVVGRRVIERMVTMLNLTPNYDSAFDQKLPWEFIQKPKFYHAVSRHAAD